MSAKVYAVLRTYGDQIFTDNVETLYGLTRRFAQQVRHCAGFELAVEPASNIVCFRYVGPEIDPDHIDKLNSQIRNRLLQDGRYYIVQTTLRQCTWLRVSLMNPLTTDEYLDELLVEIQTIADRPVS